MRATLEYVHVLDQAEQLGKMILSSELAEAYNRTREALNNNQEAQRLISNFIALKEDYEEIQRFGRYHPDYNKIMKRVREVKREMDMHDHVAAFKVAERNLQRLLDDVSTCLAASVSEQVKVPVDGAALTDTGCASGSSCGC